MKYIDEVQGDIITEEEMQERLHEYIDNNDIIETMYSMSFLKMFENLSDELQSEIYEETYDRLIKKHFYFTEYDDDEKDE